MAKTAFLFPGQGSQVVGMGSDFAERYESARSVFSAADEALSKPLSSSCFEGPAETLKLTAVTQPAILTTSIAALRALSEELGIGSPDFVCGHSLGEYSALVASGGLTLTDAVKTVERRGQYMQEAVPVGDGAMAAILGLDYGAVREVCEKAAEGDVVSPANLNSPVQIVIAGSAQAVDRALALAKDAGAKRCIKLPVSAPFHCALMEPAAIRLEPDLRALTFKDLSSPLVTNVDAAIVTVGNDARDALIRQVTAPVKFEESVRLLCEEKVTRFIEIGPGDVLTRLVKKIDRSVEVRSIATADQAEAYAKEVA